MTFNLRCDVDRDENRWDARKEAVAEVVLGKRPDVLGTQEGLPHQLADLDARLPGYARVGRGRRGGDDDEHCAIHYRTDRLDLLAWGDFWLSDHPDRPGSVSWGNDLPRMATWARFRDREGGGTVLVANTHLDHRSPAARRRATAVLAERLPGAVLVGDFNALPGGAVHRDLLAWGWDDAGVAAARTAAGRRMHPFAALREAGEATFHGFTGNARDRLDWILVPRRRAKVLSHVVVQDRPGGRFPSDHFPVVADVLFTTP